MKILNSVYRFEAFVPFDFHPTSRCPNGMACLLPPHISGADSSFLQHWFSLVHHIEQGKDTIDLKCSLLEDRMTTQYAKWYRYNFDDGMNK